MVKVVHKYLPKVSLTNKGLSIIGGSWPKYPTIIINQGGWMSIFFL